jgi:tetratricopeptide (TPR) repeat protein
MNKTLKQKITVLLAALIMAVAVTIPAYAEDPPPEPTEEEWNAYMAAEEQYSKSCGFNTLSAEEFFPDDPDAPVPPTYEELKTLAIDAYNSFLATYPESTFCASVQFSVGICYFEMGDNTNAKTELLKVVDNYADSNKVDDARYQIAFIDFISADYAAALSGFESVISDYENNEDDNLNHKVPFAYFMVAECYRKMDNMTNANAKYNELIAKFPIHSQAGRAQKRLNP